MSPLSPQVVALFLKNYERGLIAIQKTRKGSGFINFLKVSKSSG